MRDMLHRINMHHIYRTVTVELFNYLPGDLKMGRDKKVTIVHIQYKTERKVSQKVHLQ